MEEQKYIIKNQESFELQDIFECGQCFRWNKNSDKTYTGIIKNGVLNVKKEENNLIFTGFLDDNIEKIVTKYFDLNRNYEILKAKLSSIDKYMEKSIKYGKGIRILNQDLWETIISFIISANNNIPRIKGIIEKISQKYGKKVIWKNKIYYLFPSPNEMENADIYDFRNLGLGFRDKYVYSTVHMVLENKIDLLNLYKKDTKSAEKELLKLPGVGSKVADCILLFSDLKRFDVFPIDVWVRRVMNELYIKKDDEKNVSKKEIADVAYEKFGNIEGLAQQYLFYWRRD